MRILLTGAFGNVGQETLQKLIREDFDIRIFELDNRKNRQIAKKKKYQNKFEIIWGDLRNLSQVKQAAKNIDVVLHIGGIIPPLADINPTLAEQVNVGGTKNIILALESQANPGKLIFTSSIALYGDRRQNPFIKVEDKLNPSSGDEYGHQKMQAETLIQQSRLDWSIFRLPIIASISNLQMDPMLFKIPWETKIEICSVKDVASALVNAIENEDIWGKIWNIGGGKHCRTTYFKYVNRILQIFGLKKSLPKKSFSTDPLYGCYIADSKESNKILHYQHHNLEDFYSTVKKKAKFIHFFIWIFNPFVRRYIISQSPYYRHKYVSKLI